MSASGASDQASRTNRSRFRDSGWSSTVMTISCGQGFSGLGVLHCISLPPSNHSPSDHDAFSMAPSPYSVNESSSAWGTLSGTRQKISAGSRLLIVGDSLDPIHSLVGKLGTVC